MTSERSKRRDFLAIVFVSKQNNPQTLFTRVVLYARIFLSFVRRPVSLRERVIGKVGIKD